MKSMLSKPVSARADRALVREFAGRLPGPARRQFLEHSISLGSLAMLTGCDVSTGESIEAMLMTVSRFNDRVQAMLFRPGKLATTYPDSMIERPFPFNAYYPRSKIRKVDGDAWRLELSGLIRDKKPWTRGELAALPQVAHTTRHICVEGWSAIGKWGGVPLKSFLERVGADLTAKFVGYKCADDYYGSIDMPTALHPQTLLTLTFSDETLIPEFGYPMKIRMPTKLGYKNPKHVMAMFVTNDYPGGYWEDKGYNWFGGS